MQILVQILFGNNNKVILKDYFITQESQRIKTFITLDYSDGKAYFYNEFSDLNQFSKNNVDNKNNTLIGSSGDDYINLLDFVSSNGKGLKINSKEGNDIIIGTIFNDTVNVLFGDNDITQISGKNKIVTGKGNDIIHAKNISSNTIKSSGGDNYAELDSMCTNKVTFAGGNDTIVASCGENTINAGNGKNVIELSNSSNKVTTGKDIDTITVFSGLNNINSGKGNDCICLKGGANTVKSSSGNNEITVEGADFYEMSNKITTGNGEDKFILNGGYNTINSGGGKDNFIFNNFENDIVAYINGGKGNDSYDFTEYNFADVESSINITDKYGSNVIKLKENSCDYDVYFNVSIKKNKSGTKITKTTVSKSFAISQNNGDLIDTLNGVTFITDGKYNKDGSLKNITVEIESENYKLNIKTLAQEVANWLKDSTYSSSDEVFSSNDDIAKTSLSMIYRGMSSDFELFSVVEKN